MDKEFKYIQGRTNPKVELKESKLKTHSRSEIKEDKITGWWKNQNRERADRNGSIQTISRWKKNAVILSQASNRNIYMEEQEVIIKQNSKRKRKKNR